MARLSINELTTYRWSFDEDVRAYKRAGFTAIGVWRQKLADFGEEKGIELLADNQLTVSNLLWAGGFTGSDGRTFSESLEDALDALRLAASLHAGCLVLYSGGRAGHTHNHARRLCREALTKLAPMAREYGVDLAIEPMHPGTAAEWTFLTTLDETLAMLDAVDHPCVKLVFDTYHLGHDPAIFDQIPSLASRIAVVHLGDSHHPPDGDQNRCPLGQGKLPLKRIIGALSAAGYDGYYDVELLGEEIEAADYAQLLEQSHRAFADLASCQPA